MKQTDLQGETERALRALTCVGCKAGEPLSVGPIKTHDGTEIPGDWHIGLGGTLYGHRCYPCTSKHADLLPLFNAGIERAAELEHKATMMALAEEIAANDVDDSGINAALNTLVAGAYAAAAKHFPYFGHGEWKSCHCGWKATYTAPLTYSQAEFIEQFKQHILALTPADARQAQTERAINIYTSAIIKSDGKFLLIHHSNDEHIGSPVWLMPGGKPEPNESASDCLIRECREELGIELRDLSFHAAFRKVLKGKEWVGLFFNVGSFSGTPVIKEPSKHSGFAWMTLEEMKQVAVNQPEMGIAQYLAFSPHAAIASAEARARLEGMKYGHNNKHIACGCLVCAEITELTLAAARTPDSTLNGAK